MRSGFLETPRSHFCGVFLASAQTASQFACSGVSERRVRHRSEAVDVDHWQIVGRGLQDVAIVMHVHELAAVSGRAASRRERRRLERFATMRKDLPDRTRIRDERDQPDIAPAPRALERKLLPDPRHQLGPCNARGVMRAGLLMCVRRVAEASRTVAVPRMRARRGLVPLADVPDRERRDGGPERVIRREDAVIPVPVTPWRRHEIGEPAGVPENLPDSWKTRSRWPRKLQKSKLRSGG